MFGYVTANPKMMTEEETVRYRSAYCGLCKSLGKRHGQLTRLALNYDMTFLALFFGAFKMIGMELPVLKKGAKGDPVRAMQMLLLGNGYTLDLDGSFGAKTENALMSYQEDKSLTPDGSCGRKTWTALLGL